MHLQHGTVIDVAGRGVLFVGPSGSGKSDLALRMIDRGATFVSDDQVLLEVRRRGVFASAPSELRGYLEIRGLGITSMPVTGGAYLALVVELVPRPDVPRLPEKQLFDLYGEKIPLIRLNAFDVSTPLKIELAVGDIKRIGGEGPSDNR